MSGLRRVDRLPTTFTLDRRAREILDEECGGGKVRGEFIGRLLFEHRAREEARAEERKRVAARARSAQG
jgi:hypothetical protein